jgi:phage shock protein C
MKRVISVHLDNKIFQIEDDAYDALSKLLKNQWRRNEVEKQIAEHFERRLNGNKNVITYFDVIDILNQLGFSAPNTRPVKKLYRQPNDKVIAGLCSGFGEYFDIDPVIIRVLFVAGFFFMGFAFFAYIIMWIITPVYPDNN